MPASWSIARWAGALVPALLSIACALPNATTDTDTHSASTTDSTAVYAGYFGTSEYAAPTNTAIAAQFIYSDPQFILTLLDLVATLDAPDTVLGIDLAAETCPAATVWSGDHTRDLLVPQQYPTIQAAIDVAVDYQSIVVDPAGAYVENLTIQNKFIHLFSATTDPVSLTPQDPSLPTVVFNCLGGGMIGGFAFTGGTVGVKAGNTSLGMTTLVNNSFLDIETPIALSQTHFFLVDNVITGTTNGVVLTQATGYVHGNTVQGGSGIAVYLDAPQGVTVSENQFTQDGEGQGAIFMDGGAAIISDNTLTLNENAFGIFSQYASVDTGAGVEILNNTITAPKALGVVVFGDTGNSTQAYIAGNTITDTQHALADADFDWLNNYGEGNSFTSGNGLLVVDAVADTLDNTTTANDFVGLGYVRSCGTMTGNTSTGNNIFDLLTKTLVDNDDCVAPTLGTNTYDTICDDTACGQTMAVPDTPIETPPVP